MAAMGGAQGAVDSSMRPYMRLQNLFVREIDCSLPRDVVITELQNYCSPSMGKVVVPVSDTTGNILGIAYLNYLSQADAARVLERMRFGMTVCGKPVRLTHAVEPRWRDHLFGPFGFRFQLNVKNLAHDVDEPALFEHFSKYGEVYQVRVDDDDYGRRGASVQFLDESSAQEAQRSENGAMFRGSRMTVEPHGGRSYGGGMSGGGGMGGGGMGGGGAQGGPPLPGSHADINWNFSNTRRPSGGAPPGALPGAPGGPRPPPPPPPQRQGSGGPQGGLPAHLSMMLDRQSESLGMPEGGGGGYDPAAGVADLSVSGGGAPQHGGCYMQNGAAGAAAAAAAASAANTAANAAAAAAAVAAAQQMQQMRASGGGGGAAAAHAVAPGVRTLLKQAASRLDSMAELLRCPITREPFRDPVVASDGQTYERAAISSWMTQSDASPVTHQPLARGVLLPNKLIKSMVDELAPLPA
ncbi:MAG: hypothetical protein J3K34DRAFT_517406 [Monoraphidium minutum]|nr:MAG: hypothetical protein J3K34DRAFT_517406 [Monoraphidium minutum]